MRHFCLQMMSSATLEGIGDLFGYASLDDRSGRCFQVDALNAAGCYRVFVDTISGSLNQWPELTKLLDQLRRGTRS